MNISVAIMAHPSRADFANALAHSLDVWDPSVVFDPDPDGPPSARRTARLAWSKDLGRSTHRVVLQDDCRPMPWFSTELPRVVAAAPDAAIGLFADWASRTSSVARAAALLGGTLVENIDVYTPCVGLVLPVAVAEGYASYACSPQDLRDDRTLARYLKAAGVSTVVCYPNLMEHRDLASVVGNDLRGGSFIRGMRRSACLARPTDAWSRIGSVPFAPYIDYRHDALQLIHPEQERPDWIGWTQSGLADAAWAWDIPLDQVADFVRRRLVSNRELVRISASGLFRGCDCLQLLMTAVTLTGLAAQRGAIEAVPIGSDAAEHLFRTMVPGCLRTRHEGTQLVGVGGELGTYLMQVALDASVEM